LAPWGVSPTTPLAHLGKRGIPSLGETFMCSPTVPRGSSRLHQSQRDSRMQDQTAAETAAKAGVDAARRRSPSAEMFHRLPGEPTARADAPDCAMIDSNSTLTDWGKARVVLEAEQLLALATLVAARHAGVSIDDVIERFASPCPSARPSACCAHWKHNSPTPPSTARGASAGTCHRASSGI
jgi:hypothetical protein